jgi:uncharacterized membrane protein
MSRKSMTFISLGLIAVMLIAAAHFAATLPQGSRVPIHWNVHGRADNFAGAWTALLIPVATAALVSAAFFALPSFEERKLNLERSGGLYLWSWLSALLLAVSLEAAMIAAALDLPIQPPSLILGGVGVLLVLTGNQLGKSRSMRRIGIRTSATLSSEAVWMKVHRLAGKLMVTGGLLLLLGIGIRLPVAGLLALLLVIALAAFLVPFAYSYRLGRLDDASAGGPSR